MCGGRVTKVLEDQYNLEESVLPNAVVINIKTKKLVKSSKMARERSNHTITLSQNMGHSLTKKVFVAGGVYMTYYKNIHMRTPKVQEHNSDLVEFYDFYSQSWDSFGSKLSIPRHNASLIYFEGYLWLIGGETLKQPG
jgi:hypothetical protein